MIRAGIVPWEDRFGERPTFGSPLWTINRAATSQAPLANSDREFTVGGLTFEATARESWHYALAAPVLQRGGTTTVDDGAAWLLASGPLDRLRTVGRQRLLPA